jgi:hypothetical protein
MSLCEYPVGTKIKIADRVFERTKTGSFWPEVHEVPGNCVSRPSVSVEGIEERLGVTHVVLN